MPIQYRCRCGQEVVLRPREGVYVIIAAILGLSVLNAAFAGFIWFEVSALLDREQRMPSAAPELAKSLPPAPVTVSPRPESSGMAAGNAAAGETLFPEMRIEDVEIPLGLAPIESTPGPPEPIEVAPAVIPVESPPVARPLSLDRPPQVRGPLLSFLIKSPPEGPLDRATVVLGAAMWGYGFIGEEARRIAKGDERCGRLLAAASMEHDPDPTRRAAGAGPAIVLDSGAEPAFAAACAELAMGWEERWSRLARTTPVPEDAARWLEHAQSHVAGDVDRLLLVDLTESMADEIQTSVEVLKRIVPLALVAGGNQRWGWIGYRDEVTESFPLTCDGDAFIASLDRWCCAEGGDVPEGVDRAIFEALRYGSFTWRSQAKHELWVIGDAPPPYERIAPLLTLVRSAYESPERYRIDCLGVLREPQFSRVPCFQELGAAAGGKARFVAPGPQIRDAWWELACGRVPPPER